MRFDWNNQDQLMNCDLGESILVHFDYLYEKSRVSLSYYNLKRKTLYSFVFFNVLFSNIYFQDEKANSIITISAEENSKEIKQLTETESSTWLVWNSHFLTVKFKTMSGHEIQVICDNIYYLEEVTDYQNKNLPQITDGYINYGKNDINKINQLYIHDSTFKGFCYCKEKRTVSFGCENTYSRKWHGFIFTDVIFCSLSNCCSWGESIRVLDIYAEKAIPEITRHADKQEFYFTVGLELASGDTMLLTCKHMGYKEELQ